jgi:hypothetical protein
MFTLDYENKDIINTVIDGMENIFGLTPYVHKKKDQNAVDITYCSTEIYNVFNQWFKSGAENKAMPSFIKYLNYQLQMFFIKGLFRGDGNYGKAKDKRDGTISHRITFATVSKQLAPSMDNAVFTNKGSFNAKNEVGIKIIEFINSQLLQFDEIIAARKAQEELLQQKRELIVSQCISVSEMLGLKMPLTAKQFAYLKDYDLSKITDEITRAGKEQAEKERIAIEKIQKEADEKARIEAEKKILEESKIEEVKESINNQSEPQKEVLDVEIVQESTKEVKTSQKLFYGVIEFEGITIAEATAFRKFLDTNNIKFKVNKSEVK